MLVKLGDLKLKRPYLLFLKINMLEVVSLGEILVEIMRKRRDVPHNQVGEYLGPFPSGAPAIFADAAARLGLKVGFIGVVGDDDFGHMVLNRLREDGVDVKYVRVLPGYTTGTAFVMYYSTGERKFIFHLRHAAAGQLSPEDIDPDYIRSAKVLHVMGSALAVSESSREAVYKAVEIASEAGVTISFDPNLRPELLGVEKIREICKPVIEHAQIFLPSRGEIKPFAGVDDPREAALKVFEKGVNIVVVKMGSEGSLAVTKDGVTHIPAYPVEEVDPTGAGDVYDAAFILGYLKGWSIEKTLKFANAAGAIKVTRFGPMEGPISFEEVANFLRERGEKF